MLDIYKTKLNLFLNMATPETTSDFLKAHSVPDSLADELAAEVDDTVQWLSGKLGGNVEDYRTGIAQKMKLVCEGMRLSEHNLVMVLRRQPSEYANEKLQNIPRDESDDEWIDRLSTAEMQSSVGHVTGGGNRIIRSPRGLS
ncbi:hypothetical protein KKC44_05865 [Patescibacteria group bacterium]|nr:hypothetical protein [Patescibacteria group bacterium]MBU2260099.1 hypothetical protein [Patescibacteria group bacterium]